MNPTKATRKEQPRKDRDDALLGKSRSTAYGELLKNLIFQKIIVERGIKCFRCGEDMSREDFSIDHILNWRGASNPLEHFVDPNNCSFSHNSCNRFAANGYKELQPCGTHAAYVRGCRCEECTKASRVYAYSRKRRPYDPSKYNAEKRREKYLRRGT